MGNGRFAVDVRVSFFFSSRRRHTRLQGDWSSDVCSSDLVPATTEITGALKNMARVLDDTQIWVNPDCGLKTRGWDETLAALRNMVEAAKGMRDGKRET